MKILCFIDSLGSGGAQRQIVELAIGFKEKGHDVSFLIYHNITFFKKELDENKIDVHLIEEPNYLKRLLKLRKYIRGSKFDTVLSFLPGANIVSEISGLPFKNWKVVVGERSADPKIVSDFKLRWKRWMHFFADEVVSNSNENLELVMRANPLLPKKKCNVIYNILDNSKWFPKETAIKDSLDTFNLLIAASHLKNKNGLGLAIAVGKLSEIEKKKIRISWYGKNGADGSFEELSLYIREHKLSTIFTFYDSTKNIRKCYEETNAIGLFSFVEGLPNTVCEGMAMGKLIIASNISDIPILLGNSEELLVDPSNPNDMARAISYIMSLSEEECGKIGTQNKSRANRLFDKEQLIEQYLKIFNTQRN